MALFTSNYGDTPDVGVPGAKASISFDSVETATAEAAINFGDAIIAGSTPGAVIPANSAAGKFRGIALKEQNLVTGQGIEIGRPVSCQRKGRVFVTVTEAVAIDDAAYANVANPGKWCKTSTSNLVTGGTFRSAAAANGVAIVEINLP